MSDPVKTLEPDDSLKEQSPHLLTALTEMLDDAVIVVGDGGMVHTMNPAAETLTGWSLAEAYGRPWAEVLPLLVGPSREPLLDVLTALPALPEPGRGQRRTPDVLLVTRGGQEVVVALRAALVTPPAGEPPTTLITLHNLTYERTMYEALSYHGRLLNHVSDAVISVSMELRVQIWNAAAERLYGWASDEARGRPLQELLGTIVPNSSIQDAWQRLLANGIWQGDVIQHNRRGQPIDVLSSVSLLRDQAGQQIGAVAVNRDITRRKRMETDMRRREAVLSAVSYAAERLLRTDSWEAILDEVCGQLGEGTGVSRIYLFRNRLGDDGIWYTARTHLWLAEDAYPPPVDLDREISFESVGFERWVERLSTNRAIAGPVATFPEREHAFLNILGILSMVVVPLFVGTAWWGFMGFTDARSEREWSLAEVDSLRAAANILGAAIQRQQAEQALRKSEATNRALLDAMPDLLFWVSSSGDLLDVRGSIDALTFLALDESKPLPESVLVELLGGGDPARYRQELARIAEQVNDSREPLVLELVAGGGDSPRYVEVRVIPNYQAGLLLIVRDVTQRRLAEEALQQTQRLESLGILVGGIAHDFNNLLTGMLGQASLAQAKLAADHPAAIHIRKATTSAERAADLTHQLLAYAGKAQLSVQALDLNELIRDNIALLDTVVPKSVRLNLVLAPKLPAIVADAGQVQQLVMNLVMNAAEAIVVEPGEVRVITGVVEIGDEDRAKEYVTGRGPAPGLYVTLSVTDTGVGIDHRHLTRIFDPFYSTKGSGRGLGLSATIGIIRSYKGALQIRSEVGKGTTFHVLLPAGEAFTPLPITAPADTSSLAGGILVVDDEASILDAVTDILSLAGMRVLVAGDGQEGLETYLAHRDEIAMVLLDMQMPGLNGLETLQQLRQINPQLPVILSSGYSEGQAHDWVDYRHTSFLQKPYDLEELIAAIAAALGKE